MDVKMEGISIIYPDRLTIDDLDQLRFFRIPDTENMTAERWDRLRSLVHQWERQKHSAAVDAVALEEKLRLLRRQPPSPSPTTRSESSTPGPDEMVVIAREKTYAYQEELIRMGGRPSGPIQSDPGTWDPARTDEELHELNHWTLEGMRTYNDLTRWQEFRDFQQAVRRRPQQFQKYKNMLQELRESENVSANLQLQLEQQTKWDDWWEYYHYERQKQTRLEDILHPVLEWPRADARRTADQQFAASRLDELKKLLKWIREQFPAVWTEVGGSWNQSINDITPMPPKLRFVNKRGRSVADPTDGRVSKSRRPDRLQSYKDALRGPRSSTQPQLRGHDLPEVALRRSERIAGRDAVASSSNLSPDAPRVTNPSTRRKLSRSNHNPKHGTRGIRKKSKQPAQAPLRRSVRLRNARGSWGAGHPSLSTGARVPLHVT